MQPERSGSCCIIAMIVKDEVYIANVGDSRAIMSRSSGKIIEALSRDHKPEDEGEKIRI